MQKKLKGSICSYLKISVTLDDVAIQRVLREVDNKELCLALKGASEQVANVIFKNQSKRELA